MTRRLYTAIFLVIFFCAATVMAGSFKLGDLSSSVTASAECGTIPTSDGDVPHYYNNVTEITNSAGCTYTLEARYQISWSTIGGYTTSKKATIQLHGHVYVVDSKCKKTGAGDTYSEDFDVKGTWTGGEKTDTVTSSDSFRWTTTSSGCYTARNDAQGSAISVSGGGTTGTIEGVRLKITLGFTDPEVRTAHSYTTSADGTEYPVFTHRGEDGFYVGKDTKYLSNYHP